ncbi:peptidylprolyl isomerase [Delftia lacustris]|uniref:peptidylprolyl isomerase n=2 Tax=Delftia TaxID=80865 RepID=UPI00128D7C88
MRMTKTAFSSLPRTALALALMAGCLLGASARADEAQALMDGPARITTSDVNADALRTPDALRSQVLSDPKRVEQIVTSLYVRRALADEAQKQKLVKQADLDAVMRLARDKMLSDAWLQNMQAKHNLSDALAESQARNAYNAKPDRFSHLEQVQVRHILIAGDTPESKAKAEQLLVQLQSGADFAELAKVNSIDKGSAAKGGDLGYFERGRMVPEFDEAAFALDKPGALSAPVKTKFGYHILKLEARRPAGVQPYAEVREQLVAEVRAKAVQDAIDKEAEKLRAKGTLKPDAIKAYSESVKKH